MPKPLERRQRNREHDDRRGSARARGYTTQWDKAAALFKQCNPLCRMCLDDNMVTPAHAVDHIVPHKGDQTLFWDEGNWQSLCRTHHNRDKQRDERRSIQAVGADGWPL